jgi:uncharacterized protein (DUF433 family)
MEICRRMRYCHLDLNQDEAMDYPRIVVDPAVMVGKPCIRGRRIPAQLILRLLASGDSRAEIIQVYEQLTDDDITAALRSAADQLGPSFGQAAE